MKYVYAALVGLLFIVVNQFFLFVMSLIVIGLSTTLALLAEFAFLSLLMAGMSFLFALILKASGKGEAALFGGIWTALLIGFYVLIGIGNNTFSAIFGNPTVYLMFACTFFGSMLYGLLRKENI